MKRVALDLGGSFTCCAAAWDGRLVHARAASEARGAAQAAARALQMVAAQLGVEPSRLLVEADSLRLATTLPAETLAGRDEPLRVGLLVSPGCEPAWDAGPEPALTPWQGEEAIPATPLARPMVRAVPGRVAGNGDVLEPLDEARVTQTADELIRHGVRVIAVAFTHSIHNPRHELRCQELIAERHPAHLLGAAPVILSHRLGGKLGEASRVQAALLAAALHGPLRTGLAAVEQGLQRLGGCPPVLMVHRDGGLASLGGTHALQMLRSSPRAALQAAQAAQVAQAAGAQRGPGPFIVADMGGTRLELGILHRASWRGGGAGRRPWGAAALPRLVALTGGGGAIARLESVYRTVVVGPASAGADPGPACFGRGGAEPTVTDADLMLGYLESVRHAGGGMPLWREQSRAAMGPLAEALGVDEVAVARLVRAAADRDMGAVVATALRVEGQTPEEFTLLACGGGGPLHACGMAREAGVPQVLVPPHAAAYAAVGALAMGLTHVQEQALSVPLVGARAGNGPEDQPLWDDYRSLNRVLESLEGCGREALERQGVPPDQARHRVELDLRFGAQRLELPVVLEPGRFTGPRDVLGLAEQLTEACLLRFGAGTAALESGVWISAFRVFTFVEADGWPVPTEAPPAPIGRAPEATLRRRCWVAGMDRPAMLPVHDMDQLRPGMQLQGPALVELADATCLVEPGWQATAGLRGALWLTDAHPRAADGRPGHPAPAAHSAHFYQGAET